MKTRSTQKELMDSGNTSYEEFRDCLRTLERINILTCAYRPTLGWLARDIHKRPAGMTIWDIGSGGGDMLRRLWKETGRNGAGMKLTGIDINPLAKKAAEEATPQEAPITFVTADIFNLEYKTPPDFIISSLFAHHLEDDQIIRFVRWMEETAVRGWFINDLHRHLLPYYFIKAATFLFTRNRLVRHDAPLSVARSFIRPDWEWMLATARIPEGGRTIRWRFPFRYCIGRRKP